MESPAFFNAGTRKSRRLANSRLRFSRIARLSAENAEIAACCAAAGALDEPTSAYSAKVLAEKARLDVLRFNARKSGQSV